MYLVRHDQNETETIAPKIGNSRKAAELADFQDILLRLMLGISVYAHRAAACGVHDKKIDGFTSHAWFALLTNANLDARRLVDLIGQALDIRRRAKALAAQFGADLSNLPEPAVWLPDGARRPLIAVASRANTDEAASASVTDLILSGFKGTVSAAFHARAASLAEDPRDMSALFDEAVSGADTGHPKPQAVAARR